MTRPMLGLQKLKALAVRFKLWLKDVVKLDESSDDDFGGAGMDRP